MKVAMLLYCLFSLLSLLAVKLYLFSYLIQWTNGNSKAKEENANGTHSQSTAAETSKYSEHQNMILSSLLSFQAPILQ